jgi:parvulin-like peptidyl-prolyl isomerase
MLRYTLSLLSVAALWTAASGPVQAQGTPKSKPSNTGSKTGVGSSAPASRSADDSFVVGSINDKKITWGEFMTRFQKDNAQAFTDAVAKVIGTRGKDVLFSPNPKSQFTITRSEVLTLMRKQPTPAEVTYLDYILQLEALDQEAARQGVQPTDAQLEAEVTKLLKSARTQGSIPPNVTDDQFLAQQNLTRAKLKSNLVPRLRLSNLVNKDLQAKWGHPIGEGDFIQARHILVSPKDLAPDAKPEDKQKADAEALARINQVAEEIKSGKKTFEQEAQENNTDATKEKGGDLGPFMRGGMVKEFDAVVFSMKPGEVSAPVKTQFGYHLIRVDKLGKDIPADQRQQIQTAFEQRQFQAYMQELMEKRVKKTNALAALLPPQFPMGPGGMRPNGR